jgi:GTP cyclohydrolase I
MSSLVGPDEDSESGKIPVPQEVQDAIRTLIQWSGDDPQREGLLDTPKRVARAWKEYCQGYGEDDPSRAHLRGSGRLQ